MSQKIGGDSQLGSEMNLYKGELQQIDIPLKIEKYGKSSIDKSS